MGFYYSFTFKTSSFQNLYFPKKHFKYCSKSSELYPDKKRVKIAIIGAGIGGCAAGYFLEDYFSNSSHELQIDIFEKSSQTGSQGSILKYHGFEYITGLDYIDINEKYMKKFSRLSGTNIDAGHNDFLTGIFDSNGNFTEYECVRSNKSNLFIKLCKAVKTNGFEQILKIVNLIHDYYFYTKSFYRLQKEGYSFDNIEKLLRKIDPKYYTYSQHSLKQIIQNSQLSKEYEKKIHEFSSFTSFDTVGQDNNIPGIVGIYSIASSLFRSQPKYDLHKITKKLISISSKTRLFLNTHVKSVKYSGKNPNTRNNLTYVRKGKEKKKSYDYTIISFPLTKELSKENFQLDILYRDYLDCQINLVKEYIIDGSLKLKISCGLKNKLVNLQTSDPKYKFKVIRSNLPFKKPQNSYIDLVLYSVISFEQLNESNLDQIFEKGYKIVATLTNTYSVPLYKKVRYSHTPFPQVLIDGVDRSRIAYLKNYEWLIGGSKEFTCMSARNIALIISKKELGKNFVHNTRYTFNKLLDLRRDDIKNACFYLLIRATKIIENIFRRLSV